MTRAVIKLKRDISYAMPIMEKLIESCGYNEVTPVAAFRYKNFGVIVYRREIIITNAGDEAPAVNLMNFLKNIVNNADKITGRVRAY